MIDTNIFNALSVEGFVLYFLQKYYQNPCGVGELHRIIWQDFCSEEPRVAIAAPREHGKTTSGTVAFTNAALCFKAYRYPLVLSNTYSVAVKLLGNIKRPFMDDEELRRVCGVGDILRDREDEMIIEWTDKTRSAVMAKGSDQQIRGTLWDDKRPDLIIADDLEDKTTVESDELRNKMLDWFLEEVIPAGSAGAHIRVVGTILHFDSLLMRLINDKMWKSRLFKAHKDFDDFSEILWPEKWTEAMLREKQQIFISQGKADGYAQEYLNNPMSTSEGYFRAQDFIPMTTEDHSKRKVYYVGIDFAISLKDSADLTVMIVAGKDAQGLLHIVDVRKGRWDGVQINDEMFSIRERWHPQEYFVESGAIQKSLGPFLFNKMISTGEYMNLREFVPTRDKGTRAQTIKAMMRAGGVRFDEDMEGYEALKQEMLRFGKQRIHDDQVDAIAYLGLGLNSMADLEFVDDEQDDPYYNIPFGEDSGRSLVTGY
jgi:predicted phage terminase large subunit-like protein